MTIEVLNRSGELAPTTEMSSLLSFALADLKLHPECELNLTFIDDQEMTDLHVKWMDLPGTTDVMSFPMDMPEGDEAVTLGDIVISPNVAATQARTQGHSTLHEISILAVHGLLHILGYDHAEIEEEKVMFALQEDIVKRWEARG